MMITRRKFIGGLAAAGVGGTLFDVWSRDTPFPEACAVRTFPIPSPAGCVGKTALFVSDIHYDNYFGPAEAAALNRIVQQHAPDLVLMGGDLAETPQTNLEGFLAHWSPGCPTLFAPGNHDIARSADSAVMQQARDGGLRAMCNATEIWHGITVIGLPSALRMTQRLSLLQTPGMKIVLAHEPDTWVRYPQPNLLHLAGHTHGGQIRFGGQAVFLPTLGRKFPQGKFMRGAGHTLIVSAGIGCAGLHARINCPPEIVKLVFV